MERTGKSMKRTFEEMERKLAASKFLRGTLTSAFSARLALGTSS